LAPDFNSANPQGNWVFQNLPTNAGSTYTVSFWFDPGSMFPAFGGNFLSSR
jgi:hypothetical protein